MITAKEAADRLHVDEELLLGLARHGQLPFAKSSDDPKTILFDLEVIQELAR